MKHAIISLGGKQFNIQENDIIEIPGNSDIKPIVLFFSDGKKTEIGEPNLKEVHVKLDLVEEKMSDKIMVKRFKAKSRYKKTKGHRQPVFVLKVTEIGVKEPKESKEAKEETK
jgi:large subunit ribosomal protein L21